MMEENAEIKPGRIPVIDYSLCTQCKTCIEVCPTDVISDPVSFTCGKCVKYCITMEVPCLPEQFVFNYEACNSCGICIENCPAKALFWRNASEKENLVAFLPELKTPLSFR